MKVKLIAAQLVKPYVKRSKNDTADAEALCEAMSRPTMRFVPMKTAEQQAALMLVGLRDRLIRNRTQLSNAIRGNAAEFGLSEANGMAHLDPLFDRIQTDESVPDLARELLAAQAEEYAQLQAQIAKVGAKLMAWHKADECSRRLAKVPGIGPIGAALLMMKTPAPELFRSGRQFAAWIGLTPKDHSTGGKVRLGVITRAGDEALRAVLVSGAMAVIRHAVRCGGRASPWLLDLLKRKPPKLAAVALANKMARIAGKLMVTGDSYAATSTSAALAGGAQRSAGHGEQFNCNRAEPMPELARLSADGVIDRSKTRDIPWIPLTAKVAGVFGTRIAETILASVHVRARQQAGQMEASDLIKTLPKTPLRGGGRPHMGSQCRSARQVIDLLSCARVPRGRLFAAVETDPMTSERISYARQQFPDEIISHAVWLYHVCSLSLRDVELILAERGVIPSVSPNLGPSAKRG